MCESVQRCSNLPAVPVALATAACIPARRFCLVVVAAMGRPSLESLRKQRDALAASIATVRARAAKATGKRKRQAGTESRAWVLPPQIKRTLVVIYQLALDEEPVVKYLQARGRQYH